jgi:hypothetical protein
MRFYNLTHLCSAWCNLLLFTWCKQMLLKAIKKQLIWNIFENRNRLTDDFVKLLEAQFVWGIVLTWQRRFSPPLRFSSAVFFSFLVDESKRTQITTGTRSVKLICTLLNKIIRNNFTGKDVKISYILFIYLPFGSTHTHLLLLLMKLHKYLKLKIFELK